VGVDYHAFESKWHDGICYWDTKYTKWKTPEDYCKVYAEESRKAQIPFLFYYSSLFDHNPDFDEIQPLRGVTPSFMAMHRKNAKEIAKFSMRVAKVAESNNKQEASKRDFSYNIEFFDDVHYHDFINKPEKYEAYMINQIKELIDNYKPTGIWGDWYFGDTENSAFLIMDYMEKNYPDVVLSFNYSVGHNLKWAHFLSGETHNLESTWKQSNIFRKNEKPWEQICPAGHAWDVPLARPDPYEIIRIAAMVMASGGKMCFGLPSQMDGELFPEPAHNLELLGNWYKPRHSLFTESIPMKYEGEKIPGVEFSEKDFGIIGSINEIDILIHIINFKGLKKELSIEFTQKQWQKIKKIIVEPNKKELEYKKTKDKIILILNKENIDPADTILRIIT
jgi:alpha-L-fucosidase